MNPESILGILTSSLGSITVCSVFIANWAIRKEI